METDGNQSNTHKGNSWEEALGSTPPYSRRAEPTKPTVENEQTAKGDGDRFVGGEQAPQGDPIHVGVEDGQTIEEVAPQLERLRRAGKRAYVVVDGERFDNYSQEHKIPNYAELEEKKEALGELDRTPDIMPCDKYDLIGLMGGIKPATNVSITVRDGEEVKEGNVDALLNKLGLKYVKMTETGFDEKGALNIVNYFIAKTTDMAKRLQELVDQKKPNEDDVALEREIGRMLGYPETAIEYFIKRIEGKAPWDSGEEGKYALYVHSPDHFEEERQQYDDKIDGLFEKYCPESALGYWL